MLVFFRITSLLEGLSYLAILSVTLGLISREMVYTLGMAHGALFMGYFVVSLIASHKQGWSVVTWLLVFLASIVPFAFILVDRFIHKQMRSSQGTEQVGTS